MMGWPEHDDARAAFQKGLTVNGFNIGAALSAVLCGHMLVDQYGRRPALIAGSFFFCVGGLVQSVATSAAVLISGRLIAGLGVGITSCAGPAYISEVSPASIRGAMVGIYQSNICVAIFGAAVVNHLDQHNFNGWRWSLGVQVVLGGVALLGFLIIDETPRFLQSKGRCAEAQRVLTKFRCGDRLAAQRELQLVQLEIDEEKHAGSASWGELFGNSNYRNVVILGCLTQFFQIITGINAMVSYGGTLFTSLGVHGIVSSLIPTLAFLLGNTIGSFFLVDRFGRRSLLVLGMLAMGLTLLAGGATALVAETHAASKGEEHISAAAGYTIIAMVVGYMFSFGISWGFGAWLYISEIMPLRVRGKAVGLCTAVNWGPANVASAFITPMMIASPAGPGGALVFFGLVSMLVVPFAMTCMPETKGRTLEEITPLFRFQGRGGFCSFVRGNLRGGFGAGWQKAAREFEAAGNTR